MFHAVIMSIATCFGCTLYYFYAFSGTNLLTRCQSASSLFSAVFGFRNPSKEIFSELDEINAQHLRIPRSSQNTREPPEESPGGSSPGALRTPEASRSFIYGRKDFVRFRGYFPCRISETKNSRKHGTGTVASC